MQSKSTRLWAGLFVVAVFVIGIAAGVMLRPWLRLGPPRSVGPGAMAGSPARSANVLVDRLASEMELSDEQRDALEQVLTTRRERFREFHREVRGRFETEQQGMRTAIRDILTPEQVEVFEGLIMRLGAERRRGWAGGRRRPGSRPGGFRPDRRGP